MCKRLNIDVCNKSTRHDRLAEYYKLNPDAIGGFYIPDQMHTKKSKEELYYTFIDDVCRLLNI